MRRISQCEILLVVISGDMGLLAPFLKEGLDFSGPELCSALTWEALPLRLYRVTEPTGCRGMLITFTTTTLWWLPPIA